MLSHWFWRSNKPDKKLFSPKGTLITSPGKFYDQNIRISIGHCRNRGITIEKQCEMWISGFVSRLYFHYIYIYQCYNYALLLIWYWTLIPVSLLPPPCICIAESKEENTITPDRWAQSSSIPQYILELAFHEGHHRLCSVPSDNSHHCSSSSYYYCCCCCCCTNPARLCHRRGHGDDGSIVVGAVIAMACIPLKKLFQSLQETAIFVPDWNDTTRTLVPSSKRSCCSLCPNPHDSEEFFSYRQSKKLSWSLTKISRCLPNGTRTTRQSVALSSEQKIQSCAGIVHITNLCWSPM